MDDDLRRDLFDPSGTTRLVLSRRPPTRSAVGCVVSDVVWADVVRLLRWAAAAGRTAGDPALAEGVHWRLAAACADLLRRLPGLSAELGEPWDRPAPEIPAELPGPARVELAADRLAALLRGSGPLPLPELAAHVDALGEAAVAVLTEGPAVPPSDRPAPVPSARRPRS